MGDGSPQELRYENPENRYRSKKRNLRSLTPASCLPRFATARVQLGSRDSGILDKGSKDAESGASSAHEGREEPPLLPAELDPNVEFTGPLRYFVPVGPWDKYGFLRSFSAAEHQSEELGRRIKEPSAKHWERYLKLDPLLDADSNALKVLLRKGVPDHLRASVWPRLLRADEAASQAPRCYYAHLVKTSHLRLSEAVQRQIEVDLPRTFPTNRIFGSFEGRNRLRCVLSAFALSNPDVNYCQSLNFIAGIFVLFVDDETAFWCLVRGSFPQRQMVNSIFSNRGMRIADYYTDGMAGLQRDIAALTLIARKRLPRAMKIFDNCGLDVMFVASEWFLCLFSTTFSLPTVLRIWDVLMLEGEKILFRISLGLISKLDKSDQHISDEVLMQFFKNDVRNFGCDAVLAESFQILNFSRRHIFIARNKSEPYKQLKPKAVAASLSSFDYPDGLLCRAFAERVRVPMAVGERNSGINSYEADGSSGGFSRQGSISGPCAADENFKSVLTTSFVPRADASVGISSMSDGLLLAANLEDTTGRPTSRRIGPRWSPIPAYWKATGLHPRSGYDVVASETVCETCIPRPFGP